MRRIVYLPPILLSNEDFAIHYRQSIIADPIHLHVEVIFREWRKKAPLAFPLKIPKKRTFVLVQ